MTVGREVTVAVIEESTFGVVPGAPSGERLYFVSEDVKPNTDRVTDPTLSGRRGQPKSVADRRTTGGSMVQTLSAPDLAKMFKGLIGAPTTHRPVKTTSSIPGVTPLRANSAAAAGTGTLTYTTAGTTLAWTGPGGTIGVAVNVGAGGVFTLTSGTTPDTITVRVVAGKLVAANASDATITVGAGTSLLFAIGAALSAGFIFERDRSAGIAGANRYLRRHGCTFAKAALQMGATGIPQINWEIPAGSSSQAAAALDATLDDFGHNAFSNANDLDIYLDGVAATIITAAAWNWDNDVDTDRVVIGGGGNRLDLPFGSAMLSGKLSALFAQGAVDVLNQATAETEVWLRHVYQRGTGDGTAGNEAIIFDVPRVLFRETAEAVSGPKGQTVDLDWWTHYPDTGSADLEATVEIRSARTSV